MSSKQKYMQIILLPSIHVVVIVVIWKTLSTALLKVWYLCFYVCMYICMYVHLQWQH